MFTPSFLLRTKIGIVSTALLAILLWVVPLPFVGVLLTPTLMALSFYVGCWRGVYHGARMHNRLTSADWDPHTVRISGRTNNHKVQR